MINRSRKPPLPPKPGNNRGNPAGDTIRAGNRHMTLLQTALSVILCVAVFTTRAEIRVTDDAGDEIVLAQPATRIISLAPNLTELLFAAGIGDRIIGTVRHSDWPVEAAAIPLVGDSFNLDIETIVRLQPDLILLWESGNTAAAYRKLKDLGFTVYRSEPDTVDKIASSLVRLGRLGGTEQIADKTGNELLAQIEQLRKHYAHRSAVRVFYQFWDRPVFTVNGHHLINHIIELCGGSNIYADLSTLTPQVNPESVLERNPQVIIASGETDTPPQWLDDWRHWPELSASTNGHLYSIPPDYIQRHTPRIVHGATLMCEFIDKARSDQPG